MPERSAPVFKGVSANERTMKGVETKRQAKEGEVVLGSEPARPRRVKIKIQGETPGRGWKATRILPYIVLYGVDADQIHKEVSEFLAELVKKHHG